MRAGTPSWSALLGASSPGTRGLMSALVMLHVQRPEALVSSAPHGRRSQGTVRPPVAHHTVPCWGWGWGRVSRWTHGPREDVAQRAAVFLGWTGNGSLARRPSSGDLGKTRETGGEPSERQSSAREGRASRRPPFWVVMKAGPGGLADGSVECERDRRSQG